MNTNQKGTYGEVVEQLNVVADPVRAKSSAWFFKTGKGEYGEGDTFIGVKVPEQRLVAKKFARLPLPDIDRLLRSKVHEHRLTAWFILYGQFLKSNEAKRGALVAFLMKHTKCANNWDMVDTGAAPMLGTWLLDKDRKILYKLVKSKNLWERRIAIIATQRFIPHGQFEDTLRLAEILLTDKHDLIHKAVGWILREVGNRDREAESKFLRKYCRKMPRTMLRYAIEKYPPSHRKAYLQVIYDEKHLPS